MTANTGSNGLISSTIGNPGFPRDICAPLMSLAARKQLVAVAEHLIDVTRRGMASGGRPRPAPARRPAPPPAAPAAAQPPLPPVPVGQEWTEVVHQQTGWVGLLKRVAGVLQTHPIVWFAASADLATACTCGWPCSSTYYWNTRTGETTALGEPRPGPEGRLAHVRSTAQQRARVAVGGLGQLVAMGAGVGLVFALLSRVF